MKKFSVCFILALWLCICMAITSCNTTAQETFDTETTTESTSHETVSAEAGYETETKALTESTVLQMIHDIGFDKVDENILKSYVPTYSCVIRVEKDGMSAFKLITFFCDEYVNYYVILNRDGEIMKITSTEKEYNSRFVYYPRATEED